MLFYDDDGPEELVGLAKPYGWYHDECHDLERIDLGYDAPTDLKKLPKRFQSYVAKLRSRISNLEATSLSKDETDIRVEAVGGKEVMYLPPKSKVKFMTKRGVIAVSIEPGFEGLEVYGEHALVVRGRVSNVLGVALDER